MGLFGFLKKNPAVVLDKARRELAQGSARDALHRLDQLLADGAGEVHEATLALRLEAREKVIETALERAEQAEEAGYLDDAAQWVESAYELVSEESDGKPDARAAEFEIRLATLRRRAEEEIAEEEENEARAEEEALREDSAPSAFEESDPDAVYDILCDMLSQTVAPLYRDRGATFRRAVVTLNEGNGEEALKSLELLASEAQERGESPDAILFLERGRARMLTQDSPGARDDLDKAWEEIGDGPLDRGGEQSVPTLWAAAALDAGDSEAVAERLAPLADPATASPSLIELYGYSLERQERLEEARDLWLEAIGLYPQRTLFSRQLAAVLTQLGDAPHAIHCLESAIAPSCRTGNCNAPAKDLASFRQLIQLYLDPATLDTQRAGELLEQISLARRGTLSRKDLKLSAAYHRATGNMDAVAEVERLLEELGDQEVERPEEVEGPADFNEQKRAAL